MNRNRKGVTIIETMIAVATISLVATAAVTLVQLGNRIYESIQSESLEARELLRFASDFREACHRCSEAEIASDGDQLLLSRQGQPIVRFEMKANQLHVERHSANSLVLRDSYSFPSSNSVWSFRMAAGTAAVEAIATDDRGETKVTAALGLLSMELSEGERNVSRL